MTSTVEPHIPDFPVARAPGCPFDPAPELAARQQDTPLMRVRLFDGATPWLVTRYADQRALLSDPRVSVNASLPGYPHLAPTNNGGGTLSFIRLDDPEHARMRRMVTAPFAIKKIEAMRPAVQRIVDELIDELLAGPNPVDLVEAFALPVPSLVISELLGVPYGDHKFFQENSQTMIRRTATPAERMAASGALREYLDKLVGEKLAAPQEDLLSVLAAKVRSGELTREQAAGTGVLLLLAGHETTANMIALGTLALFQNPEQLALLRDSDDPKLVVSAVEELLRYLHITHNGMQRVALEDIEIAGQTIRAGEGILTLNELGDRDPSAFTGNPDELDLTRDARHHVAFGFGVHQCLGQPLARLELQVVYGTLYKRIPGLRLAADPAGLPFKHDGFVYGVYELPVAW